MAVAERMAGGGKSQPGMTKIGVVVALEREADALRRGGMGAEAGFPIVCSGQGRASAEAAAGRLIADGAGGLVSIGYSAGLRQRFKPGSIVVAETVQGPSGDRVICDSAWAEWALSALAPLSASRGHAVEVADVVATPKAKAELGQRCKADVADMESHAVASAGLSLGVRCLVIRVVLDGADQPTPDWLAGVIGPRGSVSATKLARGLLMHPGDIVNLVRLARAATRAEAQLGRVAAILVRGGIPLR